jgi:hypothetical protein
LSPRTAVSHGPPSCAQVIVFMVAVLSSMRRACLRRP